MIEVQLDDTHLAQVKAWARERQHLTTQRGKRDRYGYRGSGEQAHAVGLAAEYAVAIAFDLVDVWTPVVSEYEQLAADIGPVLNVRGTAHAHGSLILHPDDKDRFPFVLVTYAHPPTYRLCGWIWGEDGKRETWWRDPQGGRPAYFVPQSSLEDVASLYEAREYLR